MSASQRAWLWFLHSGDRLHLFNARVTNATKTACLRHGWTVKDPDAFTGFRITERGVWEIMNERSGR